MKAFFGCLFSLIVVAAIGYNTWQIQQLKAELARVKAQKAVAARPKTTISASLAELRASKRHTEKAQQLLATKHFEEAAKELALAATAAKNAQSGAQNADPLSELESTIQSLSRQASALWEREKTPADAAKTKKGKTP